MCKNHYIFTTWPWRSEWTVVADNRR